MLAVRHLDARYQFGLPPPCSDRLSASRRCTTLPGDAIDALEMSAHHLVVDSWRVRSREQTRVPLTGTAAAYSKIH